MSHPNIRHCTFSAAVATVVVLTLAFALVPRLSLAEDTPSQGQAPTAEGALPEWAVDDGEGDASEGEEASYLKNASPSDATLDLRNYNLVTPVKFQNPWGSCWAFGGTSAAETSVLTALGNTYSDNHIDFSERHLTYFSLSPVTESVNPKQVGEGLHTFDTSGNAPFSAGGNPAFITTLFGQGIGPVLEEMFPYRGAKGTTELEHFDLLTGDELLELLKTELAPTVQNFGQSMGFEATFDDLIDYVVVNRGLTKDAAIQFFAQQLRAMYEQSSCYSKEDDWSIPENDEDGDPNRLISHGMTLKDGNVLPQYWNADKTEINPECMQAIKEELASGLGVSMMYAADQSGVYTMSDEVDGQSVGNQYNQYRDGATIAPNHGVHVVGWDDTYSASNFNPAHQPPANGAWIIKNSWGSTTDAVEDELGNVIGKRNYGICNDDGEYTGYFYLSYYDKSIGQPEMMEFSTTLNEGGALYALQHDYMPAQAYSYKLPASEDVMSAANVFVEAEDLSITDVSARTPEANTHTTIAVYVLNDDYKSPTDGTLVYRSSQTFEYVGYHRITLDSPIPMRANTHFSVVTTSSLTDDSGRQTYSVAANRGISKAYAEWSRSNGRPVTTYCEAVVNEGESFLYKNGTWQDWKDYLSNVREEDELNGYVVDNFSIKAFAESKPYVLEHVEAVAATCTEAGRIEYWQDTTLNKYYADEAGTKKIALSDTVVAALGHEWGAWTKLDDTKHQRVCARDASHVETAEHEWDEGKVTKKPTTTAAGVRTFTCPDCGATKTEEIPAKGTDDKDSGDGKAASGSGSGSASSGKSQSTGNGTNQNVTKANATRSTPNTGDASTAPLALVALAITLIFLSVPVRWLSSKRKGTI